MSASGVTQDRVMGARPCDRARFDQLIVPETEVLLRLAMSLTSQQADAEDLVQETLIRAFRSISRFDGEHPRAWLFTIMRRARSDSLRRARPVVVSDMDGSERPDAPTVDSAEDEAIGASFDEVVEQAYSRLSSVDRQVLDLVDVGGLRYAEAASVLELSVDAVTSRLHRARSHLRNRLEKAGLAPRPRFIWEEDPR